MSLRILLTILALIALPMNAALAAGDAPKPPSEDWSFSGPFGTYDRGAMQRGLKIYREVCAACHSLKRIYFRNLQDLGYTEDQAKNIAAEYTVTDGPDSEGEMFERPAKLSDAFPSPYPNKQAATAANGAYPPDLSLIKKARPNGADYLKGLLTGYTEPPEDYTEHNDPVPEGKYYNKYFPGHIISMAPPLSDDQVAYEDETPQTVEQYAKDIAHFLAWAAEPEMERRKRAGVQVLIFLLVFAGIMYGIKKKIWADVH